MVHEALNGIYQRSSSDWKDILQTVSLGVIPVGSGNGLARNVRFHLGERTRGDGTAQAVLNAVRGRSTPIDLFHLEHRGSDSRVDEDSSHMLGFLSLGWGIIADIDIESERLRSLGELRFAIYAIKKIQERRLLKARLSYLKVISQE